MPLSAAIKDDFPSSPQKAHAPQGWLLDLGPDTRLGQRARRERTGAALLRHHNRHFRTEAGDAAGGAGTYQDITSFKQTEAELLRARNDAEAASTAKSEFLAVIDLDPNSMQGQEQRWCAPQALPAGNEK